MSDGRELVLSDVHVLKRRQKQSSSTGNTFYTTDFKIKCSADFLKKLQERSRAHVVQSSQIAADEDDDMLIPRKTRTFDRFDECNGTFAVRINHSLETELKRVGLQVWTGALVLVDFILERKKYFENKVILELGGGSGLPSIVAGTLAREVTVSDVDKTVLRLCELNYLQNAELTCCSAKFQVTELDWFETHSGLGDYYDCLIASDVIYENDITDAFFHTLSNMLNESQTKLPTVIISLEKRLNFTLAELDVTCKEYDHFRKRLKHLVATHSSLEAQQIDLNDIPKHCLYNRTAQLELWMISEKT